MNYNISYTVDLYCIRFAKDDELRVKGENVNMSITLDPVAAEDFLFKFRPTAFKFQDYTITYVYESNYMTMYLTDEDYVYICKNFAQVAEEIYKGYMNLKCMDKLLTFLEMDFGALADAISNNSEPDDEFASVAGNTNISDIEDEFGNIDNNDDDLNDEDDGLDLDNEIV